jgi:hypothetical protein
VLHGLLRATQRALAQRNHDAAAATAAVSKLSWGDDPPGQRLRLREQLLLALIAAQVNAEHGSPRQTTAAHAQEVLLSVRQIRR